MKVKNITKKVIELALKSEDRDFVQDVAYKLREEIINIEAQIKTAQARKGLTGEFADPNWYKRATFALKMKRNDEQRLKQKAGNLKRDNNRKYGGAIANHFVDVVKQHVDEDEFRMYLEMAKKRYEDDLYGL